MPNEWFFRGMCLLALVLNVGISGYYRGKARRASGTIGRREEDRGLIMLRLLVAGPLFLAILLYVIHPAWVAWAQVPLPGALRWLGGALAVGVAPFSHWVLRSIGRNISETVLVKASHDLVTSGPYQWIRHPLYTAGLTLLTGISLLAANAFMAIFVGIVAVLIMKVVIPREEAALIERFEDRYRRYRERTGRLLPRWPRPTANIS